jgi:hypothetical protein
MEKTYNEISELTGLTIDQITRIIWMIDLSSTS